MGVQIWYRNRLNILLMLYISKIFNYPKLSTRDMTEETEGNGDDSLRCSSWITFCQRCLGLMEEEEAKLVYSSSF